MVPMNALLDSPRLPDRTISGVVLLPILSVVFSAWLSAPLSGGDPPAPPAGPPPAATVSPRPTVFLIGDSTVKNGRGDGAGGLWGWGDSLAGHFDGDRIKVENRALGGRSSRTYVTEGLWEKVLADLRPGDFVLLQFGHNDGGEIAKGNRPRASLRGSGDEEREVVVETTGQREVVRTYGWYLRKYIADARGRGATPIVLSPVPRNIWQDGKVARAADDYGRWAAEAARSAEAAFIDLNEIVARRYESAGAEKVGRDYFTAADHTHTTRAGAAASAECVVEGLRGLAECPLLRFLTAPAGRPRTEDVKFTAQCDGSEQAYVVVFPDGFKADQPHDMLVALHGHGSDRWQYVNDPRDECRVAREAASARRMLLVSPDYRSRTSWMGPKAEADLLQVIDEMRSRYRIGKLVLCGGSMGGSSALTFAVLHPDRVQGVVSMNGTANHLEYEGFQEAIRESFGGTKESIPLEYKKRSAEYWPELLTMPVAITAGGKDELVPPGSVVRLAGVLKKLGREVLLIYRESEGHSTGYEDGKKALEFVVEKALGKKTS
jgi:lysophospholipase L1-like esterase/pimeloyl-ACP methyl ester carboxylesterase